MEATLLAAQREPEEGKLRYLGRLLGNLMFEMGFDRYQANHLVRTLEGLSYRQLMLLQVFLMPGSVTRDVSYEGVTYINDDGPATGRLMFVLAETYDLYTRGMVNNGGHAAFGMTSLVPSKIETQGIGSTLAALIGLDFVEDAAALNILTKIFMSAPLSC